MPRSKKKKVTRKVIDQGRNEAADASDLLLQDLDHRLEAAQGLLTLSFGFRSSQATHYLQNTTEESILETSERSSSSTYSVHNITKGTDVEISNRSSPATNSDRNTADERGSEMSPRSSPPTNSDRNTADERGSEMSPRSSSPTNSDCNTADERGSEMSSSVSEQSSSENFGHERNSSSSNYIPSVNLRSQVLKNTIYYLNRCERRERKHLKWFFKHFPKNVSTPDMVYSCHLLDLQLHPLLWDCFLNGRDSVPNNSSNIVEERENFNLCRRNQPENMNHIDTWLDQCLLEKAPGTNKDEIEKFQREIRSRAENLPTDLNFLKESDVVAKVHALDEELKIKKRKFSCSTCSDDTSRFFESLTENCTPWNANDYEGENKKCRINFNIISQEYYQKYYNNWVKNQSLKNKYIDLFKQRFSQKLLSYFKLHKYVVKNFKKHPLLLTAFYRGMKTVLYSVHPEGTYCLENPVTTHPYHVSHIPIRPFYRP